MLQNEIENINKTLSFFKNDLIIGTINCYCYELELPWIVKDKISNLTKPTNRQNFDFKNGVLLASNEQSFIEKMVNEEIKMNEFYIGTTPCFRDEEKIDETHFNYFMKTEIFCWGNTWDIILKHSETTLSKVFADLSKQNFLRIAPFLELEIISTSESINSYDIIGQKNRY